MPFKDEAQPGRAPGNYSSIAPNKLGAFCFSAPVMADVNTVPMARGNETERHGIRSVPPTPYL